MQELCDCGGVSDCACVTKANEKCNNKAVEKVIISGL